MGVQHKEDSIRELNNPKDIKLIMQSLADAELRDFEAQEERKLLAQQLSDIELNTLGGGSK